MILSVGVLYSAQKLLDLVASEHITAAELFKSFQRLEVADSTLVLELAQGCRWLRFHHGDKLVLTDTGENVRTAGYPEMQLRLQLLDLIGHLNPPWSKRIPNGRQELIKFLPDEMRQVFKEAGLLANWTDDLLAFWDRLALSVRTRRNALNLNTGRTAERLTVEQERVRTNQEPKWLARDTNFAGYDILSVVDRGSTASLLIEVKGSELRLSEAAFYLSRNEWKVAETVDNYCVYLWLLRGQPQHRMIFSQDLRAHVAADQGEGRWDVLRIPYKCLWHSPSVASAGGI